MPAPGDDRFFAALGACTAEFARIVDGDLDRPVPTCPGWTFRQLATHLGRGHRWAAQIVATRATAPVPTREVADGKLPEDPARHASWLNAGADQLSVAVAAAGSDPVWTMTGMRPASFWVRRRAHEAAVHLADAQLAVGRDVDLAPDLAADGVDEWLGLVAASTAGPARELRGDGQSLHFHATDPGLSGTGEWLVTRNPSGITVQRGHGKADVAVRGKVRGQIDVPAGRELGVGQVDGGLVGPATHPEAGRAHAGHRPHRIAASRRDGLDHLVRARVQPGGVPGRVLRKLPVRYLAHRHWRGGAGRHDLGRPPVATAEVGRQLPEGPSRAGRHRLVQVTVDDLGQLRSAGAQSGREAVVPRRMHRRPPYQGRN